jgi:hypothetical protein
VVDAPIETVDILPTALRRLGVEIPWSIDGIDALAEGFEGRETRMSVGREGQRFSFSTAELSIAGDLERKIAVFGSGATRDLYAFGRYGALVGQRVEEIPSTSHPRVVVDLAIEPFDAARDGDGNDTAASAARVAGRLRLPTDENGSVQIAIAVRGRIVAVGPAVPASGRERWFSIFIPEPDDREELAVFVITGPPGAPALARALTAFAPILEKVTEALRSEASADR